MITRNARRLGHDAPWPPGAPPPPLPPPPGALPDDCASRRRLLQPVRRDDAQRLDALMARESTEPSAAHLCGQWQHVAGAQRRNRDRSRGRGSARAAAAAGVASHATQVVFLCGFVPPVAVLTLGLCAGVFVGHFKAQSNTKKTPQPNLLDSTKFPWRALYSNVQRT